MKPNTSSGPLTIKTIRCVNCHALLPVECYGLNKAGPHGYNKVCKECRKEINYRSWTRRYGRLKHNAPTMIRSFNLHNQAMLDEMFNHNEIEMRGFDTHTKMEYKVFFGFNQRVGSKTITLFTRNGMIFLEWIVQGLDSKAHFKDYLLSHHIRLELSDAHLITSKTEVYYL